MKKRKHPTCRVLFSVWVWLTYPSPPDKSEPTQVIQKFYTVKNQDFLAWAGIPTSQWIHLSKSSPTVIVWASEEEIEKMASCSLCTDITPYRENIPKKMTDEIILTQLSADSTLGTLSPLFNNGSGYKGQGVVFGMISSERAIFEESSPQLQKALLENRITVLPSPLPPLSDLHPSVVICQMLGEKLTLGDTTYEGIVPEAQIVFSTSETESEVLEAIDSMLLLGVRVINYSAGIIYAEEYLDFDREIDRLARANGLLFVTVSGNRRYVSSPGMAWGALTVGNLQTKSSPTAPSPAPYFIWCRNDVNCSGYLSSPSLAHKPDVVAPGTYVPYVTPSYDVVAEMNTGTSFACPWVSGIAVQLLQILTNPSHLVLKAIIALSADRSVITEEFNPIISGEPFCRETTGFGLVNSKRAIECAKEAEIIESVSTRGFETEVFTTPDEVLAVCLAYERSFETSEDLTLSVSSLTADRPEQNLHLLEYTPTVSQNVQIRVSGDEQVGFALVIWKR